MKAPLSFAFAALLASIVNAQVPHPDPGPGPAPKPFVLHDLNFVHTSDIHSWYLGQHDTERWGANIGDVVAFVQSLRKTAASGDKKRDVVFVDTGDQTHGGGLSDAAQPEGARALRLHTRLPYDVFSPGNHELEKEPIARHLFEMLEDPHNGDIKQRYLAANVFWTHPNKTLQQLGSTHRTWTLASGPNITAVGVMFQNNAKTKDAHITIEDPESIINKPWFQDQVLNGGSEVFLLVGHMSLAEKERSGWQKIHRAIRDKHPDAPIFIFGGHTHQRTCILGMSDERQLRTIAMESGRYMETIGWVGANITSMAPGKPLELARLHLEANQTNLISLAGAIPTDFVNSSEEYMKPFRELATEFKLDEIIGCLKNDYPWDSKKYFEDDKYHALNIYRNVAFPSVVQPEGSGPYALLLNDGFIRGPLFKGVFTLNDKFINTPYDSQPFMTVKMPKAIAEDVADEMLKARRPGLTATGQYAGEDNQKPMTLGRYMRGVVPNEQNCDITLGSSTPLKQYFPNKYGRTFANGFDKASPCDPVDFVTLEFLKKRTDPIITASMKKLMQKKCQIPAPETLDWKTYGSISSGDVIKEWVKKETKIVDGIMNRCADDE